MATVVFYEKPGCAGNARQKALLVASGHTVEPRNLLTAPWSAATLRPFFGARPVGDWFNRSAPRVKSREIEPEAMEPDVALAMMIAEPLLIRRPLMKVGDRCEAGFDQDLVAAWIGLRRPETPVTDACARSHKEGGSTGCSASIAPSPT